MEAVAIDWDQWRAEYAELSFAEQQAFYRQVAIAHPEQQHFDLDAAVEAFKLVDEDSFTVAELGGWDGALAGELIARFPILRWINWDIVAVEPQVCVDHRYFAVELDDWFWSERQSADVFVATHMIEHIRASELEELFDCLDVGYIYLEAPLTNEGQQWAGYRGSHILELGWREVTKLLTDRGYEPIYSGAICGMWQST